jgi:dethiobiotin synthetase
MTRPRRLVGIVGTHTEVGKTWVAHDLLCRWRAQGLQVAARKPVQSFEPGSEPTDAERLAAATGEDSFSVCPRHRWYPLAMAPPMAADVLGHPRILLQDLTAQIVWPEHADVGVIETAGGVRSPLAHDGDSVDLLRCLRPDQVLLIADAGLGTLNAIRLATGCLDGLPLLIFLNRFDPADPLHSLNRQWLANRYGLATITTTAALASAVLA